MRTREDLSEVLEQARAANRRSVLLLVSRNGNQRFVTVEVGAA